MDISVLESRIKGSLWGVAVGDALGAPYEFGVRGTYTPTKEMEYCKRFQLVAGSFTDDTSMQLCLAVSLSKTDGKLDWVDVAQRWVAWWKEGYMSVNGKFFDIGQTIAAALGYLSDHGLLNPPRPTNPPNMNPERAKSGNGSLMRLSPVPAALHRDPSAAFETAALQSKITHSSSLCVDSCVLATAYIIGFYHAKGDTAKERKERVLSPDFTPFADGTPIPLESDELNSLHRHHSYKAKTASEIQTTGFVLDTFEAALWALWQGNTFEEGLLLLLPLGNDVDTVCAVYGSLAGACYGYDDIPSRWLEKLQKPDMLKDAYERIVELGLKP